MEVMVDIAGLAVVVSHVSSDLITTLLPLLPFDEFTISPLRPALRSALRHFEAGEVTSPSPSFLSLLLAAFVLGTAGLNGRLLLADEAALAGLLWGVVGLERPGLELALEGRLEFGAEREVVLP